VIIESSQLLAFLIASIVVTAVPGPDMALITRQVLVGGVGLAQRTIAGNLTGLLVHGLALAAGLSALLVASSTAYTIVKLAGAAYLIYLGVQSLRSARRPQGDSMSAGSLASGSISGPVPSRRAAYVQGLVSTVLNPKPALFFLSFLPQFIDAQRAVLPQAVSLSAIHIVVGLIWLSVYARVVQRARQALTRPVIRQWLEGVTGAVLIGLGLRVALERR
jgi:threonine/homoserine/homoserine lactone efflux protein